MNSIPLSFLTELVQFGPSCLNPEELEQRMKSRTKEYYQILAEGLLQLRGRGYWEFHKTWLRKLGIPLSWPRLIQGLVMAFFGAISHPILALKSLARWWSRAWAKKQSSPAKA